ncbi:hypothetical protein [Acidithiobacillus sp.]
MSGNIMGLIGVTLLAVIGIAVLVFDHRRGKRHKKGKGDEKL